MSKNPKLNISIDVGGTNTRLQFETIQNGQQVESSEIFKVEINSKQNLQEFIRGSINKQKRIPNRCTIGFAGIVLNKNEVNLTRWLDRTKITLQDLYDCGLPENKTLMLNDMELAGYGFLDLKESECEFTKLYEPPVKTQTESDHSRSVLLAPGTGFGTTGVITGKTRSGEKYYKVIPSEVQHITVSALDEKHEKLIKWMKNKMKLSNLPSWEDFVSGSGLELTYQGLIELFYPNMKPEELSAEQIAEKALKDEICREALDIFYRCAGKLTHAIALFFRPFNGIYLCGSTTTKNAEFIKHGGFLEELQKSTDRENILKLLPVYIIEDEDINIKGGLWACRNIF
ncbi:MAG: ROK family protein [Candidatus Cloacimonetes bacterium]|nr:ROK family protein [Candidatus Cloacimonadota bacterium]